jgi:hypothetical protein
LNFLDGTDEIVLSEAINIDRFGERQEVFEEVNVLVCPARLFAHEQVDTERSRVWFQAGAGSRQSEYCHNQQQNDLKYSHQNIILHNHPTPHTSLTFDRINH